MNCTAGEFARHVSPGQGKRRDGADRPNGKPSPENWKAEPANRPFESSISSRPTRHRRTSPGRTRGASTANTTSVTSGLTGSPRGIGTLRRAPGRRRRTRRHPHNAAARVPDSVQQGLTFGTGGFHHVGGSIASIERPTPHTPLRLCVGKRTTARRCRHLWRVGFIRPPREGHDPNRMPALRLQAMFDRRLHTRSARFWSACVRWSRSAEEDEREAHYGHGAVQNDPAPGKVQHSCPAAQAELSAHCG